MLTSNLDGNFHNFLIAFVSQVSIPKFAILFESDKKFFFDRIDFNEPKEFNSKFGIFPNPQNVLKGHTMNVFVVHQPPQVTVTETQIKNWMVKFLAILAEKENLKLSFTIEDSRSIYKFIKNRNFELTLNNIESTRERMPRFLTYDETAYCILVPNPEISPFNVILFKVNLGLKNT